MIPEFLKDAGPQLPLVLLFIALLGLRMRVRPRASVWIGASPDKVFELLDLTEGESQRWQRTKVTVKFTDAAKRIYRIFFQTPLATGAVQASSADFRIAAREPPRLLDIERSGLEGKSDINELLRMRYELEAEGRGTRLSIAYFWGPRALLAQLLARADLWGSVYRIKGLAETGTPDFKTDSLISAGVALVTGIVTLATFAYAFGAIFAAILVGALLVHEFGHLLAYRLIGQPWGRMVFLPFLGAIAVPRIGFTTQAQVVFSALMGPGFSVAVPILAALHVLAGLPGADIAVTIGLVCAALNLFNLLPVEPLDGGVALRPIMERIAGRHAQTGLVLVAMAIAAAGWRFEQVLLLIFGGLAVAANLRRRRAVNGPQPLTSLQVAISLFAFMAIVAAYAELVQLFLKNLPEA